MARKNLFEAIREGNTQYFAFCLELITWPRTTDYFDVDLLLAALEFGRKEIVNHLLDQKCRLTKPGNRVRAIHLALMQSNFCDVVKRLLNLGARVSDTNANGDNAIHVAFVNGAPGRTIDMLLLQYLNEASENAKNADGLSVLHVACTRKNLFIVKKLVGLMSNDDFVKNQLNQQIDLRCGRIYAGYTPLHCAVSYSRKEIMKFLVISYNADVYVQDANHSTPLHLALECRDFHAIDLIVAYNFPTIAYKDIVNCYGLSHFMAACACNIQGVALKFMEIAAANSLKVLVNRQVNIVNERVHPAFPGYSPMHFAAEFGHTTTVHQLVKCGASFFIKTANDYSPLVVALKHGHEEIVRLLFWRYKQYRFMLFNGDSIYASGIGKSSGSNRWYLCTSSLRVLPF